MRPLSPATGHAQCTMTARTCSVRKTDQVPIYVDHQCGLPGRARAARMSGDEQRVTGADELAQIALPPPTGALAWRPRRGLHAHGAQHQVRTTAAAPSRVPSAVMGVVRPTLEERRLSYRLRTDSIGGDTLAVASHQPARPLPSAVAAQALRCPLRRRPARHAPAVVHLSRRGVLGRRLEVTPVVSG